MIGDAIFDRLSNDSGVEALVSNRIYPLRAKENAQYPLVLYQQVSSGQEDARCLTGAADHFRTLQQLDVFSASKSNADAIAKAVRTSLDGLTNQTWGEKTILSSTFDEQFDSGFEEGSNLHRIILQFRIVYKET